MQEKKTRKSRYYLKTKEGKNERRKTDNKGKKEEIGII